MTGEKPPEKHKAADTHPLGISRGTIVLRPYDPRWAEEFVREAGHLRQILDPVVFDIEHVGSTAVPGLVAKPLLDLALMFPDRRRLEEARHRLRTAGYEDRGDHGGQGGVIVAKGPRSARTHVLHLVERADSQWARWLAFRDALRQDAARREEYAALKTELAVRFPTDRPSYLAGKRRFIEETRASSN